eukprot:6363514-Pyramimonas_sp.AAC.1
MGPKRAQRKPRDGHGLPRRPKTAQTGPRTAQDCPKRAPHGPLEDPQEAQETLNITMAPISERGRSKLLTPGLPERDDVNNSSQQGSPERAAPYKTLNTRARNRRRRHNKL